MGASYGVIFGWMDIEDAQRRKLQFLLMKEESYCWPIGIVFGGIGGFMVEG